MNAADREARLSVAMNAPIPHCSGGSCRQGRAKCETPEACGIALPEPAATEWNWQLIGIYVAVAVAFIWVLILSAWPIN